MIAEDLTATLQQQVEEAIALNTPLKIAGGQSKFFLGHKNTAGKTISTLGHNGIINYQPTELVLTARSGTLLGELEQTLAKQGQMLAFEPPHFSDVATLGGAVATGLSGPRRPFTGSVRDFVLGCKIINGKGEILHFGGEVMKNVAGYDVSRVMAGAMGTLGLLLEISLKVLPRPEQELTVCFELSRESARAKMLDLARQCLPVSALSYDAQQLYVRLSGSKKVIQNAWIQIGGDLCRQEQYWQELNGQSLEFFKQARRLWRISVPPATKTLALAGAWFEDWGGSLRWLASDEPAEKIFQAAEQADGHALLFRDQTQASTVFQAEAGAAMILNRRLKQAFDPQGLFNPGRMFRDW